MPSDAERMIEIEKKLESKLDENLKATNDVNTSIALLSQAFASNEAAHKKFEDRTDRDISKLFSDLEKVKTTQSEGKTDRQIMEQMRSAFVRYVATGVLGVIASSLGGAYYLITQITKITGGG